jgi:2',3'-cyclic-nucleotide 2'-phosphodiesterase (5'-nucleotidase family)
VTFGRRPLVVLLILLLCACARSAADRSDIRRITIVDFSDWHGQLEPVPVTVGGVTRLVGGAAVLKAYFDRERGDNPGGTLVVTAGDAFGATPPVASLLFTNESGRFLQISGFAYRFDPRAPAGQRVTSVTAADGAPIPRDDRVWKAVTVDFAYAGGDGYTMLNNGTGTTRDPIPEIIARAVSQPAGATARLDGRVVIEREVSPPAFLPAGR